MTRGGVVAFNIPKIYNKVYQIFALHEDL